MPGRLRDREELAEVLESLELHRVAGQVQEEHRPLLAGLALEADVGSMTKSVPTAWSRAASSSEALDAQHQPEVRHGHVVPVDRVWCPRRVPGRGRRPGG